MNNLDEKQPPLAERILDCFPSGTYSLTALLRVMEVVETRAVETAAVECRLQPRLLMNPDFVATWAATPEKLLMLVMHELHHVLLGHTRLFPRSTKVDNLVFDAVINSLLCRMFPALEHTSFFTGFYDSGRFPECLLRPPAGWTPDGPVAIPAALKPPEYFELAEAYRALYSSKGASYQDLYDALRRMVSEQLAASAKLIGDHQGNGKGIGPDDLATKLGSEEPSAGLGSADGRLEDRSPLLFDIVREIVERWPQPPDPIAGRSLASIIREETVRPQRRRSNRAALRGLLRRIADMEDADGRHRERREESAAIVTPIPTFDRRSVVRTALGSPVLLHTGTLNIPRRRRGGNRVHVYVDVSGSIGNLKGALYGAVLDCQQFVHPKVHLFSTNVVDASLAELRRGVCHTTGGTSIECVAQHIREHRIARAVILTDGYVGRPGGEDQRTLSRAKLGVALTSENSTRKDLEDVADYWVALSHLPEIARILPANGRGLVPKPVFERTT